MLLLYIYKIDQFKRIPNTHENRELLRLVLEETKREHGEFPYTRQLTDLLKTIDGQKSEVNFGPHECEFFYLVPWVYTD